MLKYFIINCLCHKVCRKAVFLAFSCLTLGALIFPKGAMAVEARTLEGRTSASFLRVNPSPRLVALGGRQSAASGQLETMYANPASLTRLILPSLWISHQESYIKSQYETVAFGYPFKKQTAAVSWQQFTDGKIDRAEIENDQPILGLGSYNPKTTLINASWAGYIHNQFSLGISGKGWNESLDQTSKNGWALDLGLMTSFMNGTVDTGVAARNIGPRYNGYELPQTVSLGAAAHLVPKSFLPISLLIDYEKPNKSAQFMRMGAELNHRIVSFRGGYRKNLSTNANDFQAWSAGMGIKIRKWILDYAFQDGGEFGGLHHFSLTMGFGLSTDQKKEVEMIVDEQLLKRMKVNSKHHFNQGEAAVKKGNWSEAVIEFSRAKYWDPKNEQAQREYERAGKQLEINHANTLVKEAKNLMQDKQWIDAALKLKEALQLHPAHSEAQDLFLMVQFNLKSLYVDSLQKNEEQNYFDRGIQYYIDGKFNESLAELEKLHEINPDWPQLNNYISKVNAHLKSLG